MRFGEYLVALLERHGVTHVFGIPGVHTAELYRGLAGSGIRHVTPRHEQGAGFMADGYARVTGKPGVCFVITGPGVTNIATAMAQAYQDSIPMLVISGVARDRRPRHGARACCTSCRDQQGLASKLAEFSHTLLTRRGSWRRCWREAFRRFHARRARGPVHIEIPLDVMAQRCRQRRCRQAIAACSDRARRRDEALRKLLALLDEVRTRPDPARRRRAARQSPDLAHLAERLDAPAVMTVNGRGLMPLGHPLAVPASPSLEAVRKLDPRTPMSCSRSGPSSARPTTTCMRAADFDIPGRADPRSISIRSR